MQCLIFQNGIIDVKVAFIKGLQLPEFESILHDTVVSFGPELAHANE